MLPRKFIDNEGRVNEPVDRLWQRVKRWARRHGHEWQHSHVYGIAPI